MKALGTRQTLTDIKTTTTPGKLQVDGDMVWSPEIRRLAAVEADRGDGANVTIEMTDVKREAPDGALSYPHHKISTLQMSIDVSGQH